MLTSLHIRNLALVQELEWQPGPGYTAVTGETGAGKSIILGALKLILGERADKTLIRSGADACTVEAVFAMGENEATAALNRQLEEQGVEPCEEGQLLIKRSFNPAGANRQFINGSPTTLAVLKELADGLIDLHGPHDHQSLFSVARQLELLDRFAGAEGSLQEYQGLFHQAEILRAERDALASSEAALGQEIELLRFQKSEIESAALDAAEAGRDEQRLAVLANSRRLLETGAAAQAVLDEAEDSALTRHGELQRLLRELERIDPAMASLAQRHASVVEELADLGRDLGKYLGAFDLDPEQLQELEERVNLVQSLKRKYGPGVEDILAFGEKVTGRLEKITGRDAELERLEQELAALSVRIQNAGRRLGEMRRKAHLPLAAAVTAQLRDLGFKQSSFEVELTALDEPRLSGLEAVEFLFAPNPGEPTRPLRAIASSGEISRVMLALKTALAAQDAVPLLVFDEVDANIGGEIAHSVGAKMLALGSAHQVLTITHLPQVAARAQTHFVVSKQVEEGRTLSQLTEVAGLERVKEIARMLGGQTESARAHAMELLGEGK